MTINPLPDFTKPIQTRDGRPAKLLEIQPANEHPVLPVYAAYKTSSTGSSWLISNYHSDGKYLIDSTHALDLVNVPTFDPRKPVKTTEGLSVRIICTDLKNSNFPIAAAISLREDHEVMELFTAEGKYLDTASRHRYDLENI